MRILTIYYDHGTGDPDARHPLLLHVDEAASVREVKQRLSSGKLTLAAFTEFDYSRVDADASIIDFLNACQDMHVGEIPLPEFLNYQGVSCWPLIADKMGLFGPLKRVIFFLDFLYSLLDEYCPDVLLLNPCVDDVMSRLFSALQHRLPVHFYPARWLTQEAPGSLKARGKEYTARFPALYNRGLSLCRCLSNIVGRNPFLPRPPKKLLPLPEEKAQALDETRNRVLFCSFQQCFRFNAQGAFYDEYFEVIHEQLRKGGDCDVWCVDTMERDDPAKIEKLASMELPYPIFSLDAVEAASLDRLVQTQRKRFYLKFKQMRQDAQFRREFRYKGTPLFAVFEGQWHDLLHYFIPERGIRNLARAASLLDRLQPRALMVVFETGVAARCLIIEAKRRGIATIGLTHGIVGSYYMHKNQEPSPDLERGFYGFIPPDVTCVYGEVERNRLLQRGAYPQSALAITGDWRMDRLYRAAQMFDRDRWKRNLGLKPGKKIAAILTGGIRNDCLPVVLSSFAPLAEEWDVLIKLHPKPKHHDYFRLRRRSSTDPSNR